MIRKDLKYLVNGDRQLFVLRGCPGSGKSTFIQRFGLEQHTISMDALRKVILNPVLNEHNQFVINNNDNRYIFKLFTELLEKKLSLGGLIVVDNLNIPVDSVKTIHQLAVHYGYNVTVINFDVPLETLLARNNTRLDTAPHKWFQDERVIIKKYHQYTQSTDAIKKKFETLDANDTQAIYTLMNTVTHDLNAYSEIKVIGDIHGCYTVLREALPEIKEDTFYIFLGDYIDRGIENHEVVTWLADIMNQDNVILLEGNHEIYLRAYAHNVDLGYGKEFTNNTKVEFDKKGTKRKHIKQLVKQLRTHYQFTLRGKTYLATHGGVLPRNVMQMTQETRIHGVGDYGFNIDEAWEIHTEDNPTFIQFHGHRNKLNIEPEQYKRSFNLENGVDSGGYLRVATIKDEVHVDTFKNDVVKDKFKGTREPENVSAYVKDVLDNKKGRVRELSLNDMNVRSIRFNRKYMMHYGTRTEQVIRGLFIDDDDNILLRGYDKFYNHDEHGTIEALISKLTFPVTAFKKENGYLGLVSYSNKLNDFIFATKSMAITHDTDKSNDNHFSVHLRQMFHERFNTKQKYIIKQFLLLNNATLSFEVISQFDKHITDEAEDKLVILDAIKNTLKYDTLNFKKLKQLKDELDRYGEAVHLKQKTVTLNTPEQLKQYIENDRMNMKLKTEGHVFTDKNGHVFKFKSLYYLFWKEVRNTFQRIIRREQTGKHVHVYVPNFLDWHGLNDTDFKSERYILNTLPHLEAVFDNLDDFRFDSLMGNKENIDIPKIANDVEERMNA